MFAYAGIEALGNGCPKIKSFIMKGCLQMTDRAISSLAQTCPDLETLNLRGCSVSIGLCGVFMQQYFPTIGKLN